MATHSNTSGASAAAVAAAAASGQSGGAAAQHVEYMTFTPLGAGSEVGRSCHLLKFKVSLFVREKF